MNKPSSLQNSPEKLELEIESASSKDLAEIVDITRKAYQHPHKPGIMVTKPHEPENLQEQLENKETNILVARHNDQIIGAVRHRITEENNLYFDKLVTLPEFRNKNVGSSLLQKLEEIAVTNGHPKILLECAQEKGLPDYYKKYGYQVDEVKKHHDHHDVYMSKEIHL